MRPLGLAILFLTALVIGLFFALRGKDEGDSALAPAGTESSPVPARVEAATADEPAADAGPGDTRRAPVAEREAIEDPPPEACIVRGAIVDEADAPLVGVTVRLMAYQEWAEGHDVPRLPGPYDYRGWEEHTDEAGRFRFEAPAPTAKRTWLKITPDEFHDSAQVFFGHTDRDERPPLQAGDNDLGVFRLATTGAIRGVVRDEEGFGLAEVQMGIGSSRSTTYQRDSETQADGSYVIANVPPGTYGVKAQLEGYLYVFEKPHVVERERFTGGVDFTLHPAPTIEGRVIDDARRPLEGVKLSGFPRSSGAGALARSDAEGRFVIHLPQDEPYTLAAKLDGYATFGLRDRTTLYEPGTTGLEIVLPRAVTTRFVVVDAETGEPISTFGILVHQNAGQDAPKSTLGYSSSRRPRVDTHPGGELEVAARPGLDRFEIAAPGYRGASGEIAHDTPDSNRQVVSLEKGGSITGRVRAGDDPVVGVFVQLERGGFMGFQKSGQDAEDVKMVFRVRGGEAQTTTTDAEGRFWFAGLVLGKYRVIAKPKGGAPIEVVPIDLSRDEAKDVGDLHVVPGGTIAGRVLVPMGRTPGGLEVYLDDWRRGVTTVTDAGGEFHFENLSPGDHALAIADTPGVLAGIGDVPFHVASGETAEVTIDLTDHGTCDVTLTLDFGDLSPAGCRVFLVPVEYPDDRYELGEAGEDGRVSGWARARGTARVEVRTPSFTLLEHPTARLPLALDEPIEETLRFSIGGLRVVLPAGMVPPADGSVNIALRSLEAVDGPPPQFVRIQFRDLTSTRRPGVRLEEEGRRVCVDLLTAGDYEMTFELIDAASPVEEFPVEGHGIRIARVPVLNAVQRVVVRAGEVTEVQLR